MKLSFVVPAYNEEKTISKCLESIFREIDSLNLCSEVEVIVVNNASTDNTAEVVKSFPTAHLVNEQQKGISCARACGFDNSHGDLVANIDADNCLPTGWLGTVLQEYKVNDKLVCLSGPLNYMGLTKVDSFLVKIFYSLAYFF
ncbi:MAG: glycosyltransferase family A protein, partial [Candidatus Magasanikbacteria bacterium]|nr:glycosyltransferase family A protein [Candidatus Magasanikbacteria bacterium]